MLGSVKARGGVAALLGQAQLEKRPDQVNHAVNGRLGRAVEHLFDGLALVVRLNAGEVHKLEVDNRSLLVRARLVDQKDLRIERRVGDFDDLGA